MRREGERAVAEVADNGPRLTDEAFSRLSELGKSTRKEGLGLGLGITKELAEGLGGSIKFERRSERGLTVTVTVPLCPEDKVKAYWSEQKTKNA
jgi:signal transduction histidine kinase